MKLKLFFPFIWQLRIYLIIFWTSMTNQINQNSNGCNPNFPPTNIDLTNSNGQRFEWEDSADLWRTCAIQETISTNWKEVSAVKWASNKWSKAVRVCTIVQTMKQNVEKGCQPDFLFLLYLFIFLFCSFELKDITWRQVLSADLLLKMQPLKNVLCRGNLSRRYWLENLAYREASSRTDLEWNQSMIWTAVTALQSSEANTGPCRNFWQNQNFPILLQDQAIYYMYSKGFVWKQT